ncbi:MAG: flavodoxin-dependent (E)-4-hydroxy-3-methylbut-2-enyl-diphosphate synthase [Candidatus Omnitrophota bacterium]|jgi:(E)-4-hydroxy-3-methylbut-2-enyl-diphosphate synthase
MIKRRKTRVVKVGGVPIGGGNPVVVQSMLKTKTSDIERAAAQLRELEKAGCEIIRVAVKDSDDARAIRKIKEMTGMPLVADIHFNWKLALAAIENGADKIRLNPGNIHKKAQIREVVSSCKRARIPIRVGLNSGSVGGKGSPVTGMVNKCREYLRILEGMGFYDTVISLKASNIRDTIDAYSAMASVCDYPFHLGVTATGLPFQGAIKSSIAIGALLLRGIGDTIRVSLTDEPWEEVKAAFAILESLGLRSFGPQIISCPTCGRCQVDLVRIVKDFEKALIDMRRKKPLTVALMGCEVNGPGEAKHADAGIAFGRGRGMLFKKGKAVKRVPVDRCIKVLLNELIN